MKLDIVITCSSFAGDLLSTGKLQVELVDANVSQLVETLDDSQLAKMLSLVSQEIAGRAEGRA